jgi:hypothetical protein
VTGQMWCAVKSTPDAAVEAHAGLPVDGFLLWAVNFNKGQRQAALLLDLLFGLQHLSGKPVVAGGLSHWHLSALA